MVELVKGKSRYHMQPPAFPTHSLRALYTAQTSSSYTYCIRPTTQAVCVYYASLATRSFAFFAIISFP